jgi:hypothetical protein
MVRILRLLPAIRRITKAAANEVVHAATLMCTSLLCMLVVGAGLFYELEHDQVSGI